MSRPGLLLAICAPLAIGGPAAAAPRGPGDLDRGFGTGGRLTSDLRGDPQPVAAAALRADGGAFTANVVGPGFTGRAAVQSYGASGRLDRRFGSRGRASTTFTGSGSPVALVVAPGGRPVVVGTSRAANGRDGFALARFTATGRPDRSFGSGGGLRTTGFDGFDATAHAAALQPDGKILVGGSRFPLAGDALLTPDETVIARYDADGTLDPSFGDGGVVVLDPQRTAGGPVRSLLARPDGSIVSFVVSTNRERFTDTHYLVALRPDGALDTAFGSYSEGSERIALPGRTFGSISAELGTTPAGKILLAGGWGHGSFVSRYEPDGSTDAAYGGGPAPVGAPGIVRVRGIGALTAGFDRAGRVVLAGTTRSQGGINRFALARVSPQGTVDRTFGRSGRATARFRGRDATIGDLVLRDDGRLLAFGSAWRRDGRGRRPGVLMARFLGGSDRSRPTIRVAAPRRPRCGRARVRAVRIRLLDASPLARATVSIGGRRVRSTRRARLILRPAAAARPRRLVIVATDIAGNRSVRAVRLPACAETR